MSNATLYLIQSNYAATANILNQLAQVLSEQDQVVFLGESVLCLNQAPDFYKPRKRSLYSITKQNYWLTQHRPTSQYSIM